MKYNARERIWRNKDEYRNQNYKKTKQNIKLKELPQEHENID
jgi:hypothetical protein